MKLNRNHMLYLINKIRDGFEANLQNKFPKKGNQYYGYGEFDPKEPSIRDFMEKNEQIAAYIKGINKGKASHEMGYRAINGKKLYEFEQDAKRLRTYEFELDEFYSAIYLYAAGFESANQLVAQYEIERPSTIYDGYYFSFKDYTIKEFVLSIDFSSEPYLATEWGLHDDKSNPLYVGTASLKGQHLYIDLEREKGTDKLKFIAHTGKIHPKERKVTPCVFLGISVHAGNIIHVEAVLIQRDADETKEMTPGHIMTIKKYLMLKRNNYRLKYFGYSNLEELKVKAIPVDRIDHMIGIHRVWSMSNNGDIIQSKFVIEENYTSFLYSNLYNNNEAKQVCLLNISQAINRRLCISTHPDQGTGIITYCILDIPPKEYTYIQGVFCHVGLENLPSRAGYIIMMKETSDNFEPMTITREEFNNIANGDKKLIKMRGKLLEWNNSSRINSEEQD